MTDHTETYRVHVVLHVDASSAQRARERAETFLSDAFEQWPPAPGIVDYTVLTVDEPIAPD